MSCPLLQWVSQIEIQDKSTKCQLQLLWAEILNCLRSSQPTIIFDSVLLKLQAPLLEKTLEHPNPSISEPTITFWNSTYGEQTKLDYPQSLLHVLDKLSRNGKINLHKRSLPYLERCHSRLGVITAPQRYRVTATHSLNSKRVEFVEDIVNQLQHEEKLSLRLKRQRLELTEHQKEVRRAQQGRERDCSGHGPGIRTYTSVDFSQGNEDSQESQEIRNPESIMEMLKRAA
jgi:telomere-associated protein RIF1